MSSRFPWPGGARFAFTIIDDTDVATLDNVLPIYRLLESLGFRTTKTVWPVDCPEGSRDFATSETLESPAYREFVVDLERRGFEVTWHGATMESSPRERTIRALDVFRTTFGRYPRIHVNHSFNRENMYWGTGRIDDPVLRRLYSRVAPPVGHYCGDDPASPYWWGDHLRTHFTYARNLTFNDIDTGRINPSMPYADPGRPGAPLWFSASDADGADELAAMLAPEHQARLERDGGLCIVATHLGKGFVREGRVHPLIDARLRELAKRRGWFPPVGELLDWLRRHHHDQALPASEWRRMQWTWASDLVAREWRHRQRRGLPLSHARRVAPASSRATEARSNS